MKTVFMDLPPELFLPFQTFTKLSQAPAKALPVGLASLNFTESSSSCLAGG